jgi:PadR family transcriptional regulator, regulatory protein PadR
MPMTQLHDENDQTQMRKGSLNLAVLLIIARGKVYSSDILAELEKSDLIIVEGTLYPLLSRLKNMGLLTYAWQESQSGPPRKYYSLTDEGKATLKTLINSWKKLDQSINHLIKQIKLE